MSGKFTIGSEPVMGLPTPSKKRDYRVTNRLQEGKRPLYAVVFNFIDSRHFNVFATVGGNRVRLPFFTIYIAFSLLGFGYICVTYILVALNFCSLCYCASLSALYVANVRVLVKVIFLKRPIYY